MQHYFVSYMNVTKGLWRWPNFSPSEMACHHCGELLIDEEAMDNLQKLRDKVGAVININSAYRCAVHNRNVGGARLSMHRLGKAFDLSTIGMVKEEMYLQAHEVGFTGFGFYDSFLHVDTGKERTWGSWHSS